MKFFDRIVKKTLRVPMDSNELGNGKAMTRQLDVALISVGFKLSRELLTSFSVLHPVFVKDIADRVLQAVRELVGDHVEHNVYFKNFPDNVPDTIEFWTQCIVDALFDPTSAATISVQLESGMVNLLDLPKYGKYQHRYEEMVAAHEQFIPCVKDRVTLLHRGKTLTEEVQALYLSLASSPIPLNEDDRILLAESAVVCLDYEQPKSIPVRENKALINRVRLERGKSLLVDTVTDVLRLACAISGGDVTLSEVTKFKSFPRPTRRALMEALNAVVADSPAKLADVNQYQERWKRLGERIRPHEYAQYPHAQDVFAVARGDKTVRSFAARVEIALASGEVTKAVSLLRDNPGMLIRNLDRLLRLTDDVDFLEATVRQVIAKVSSRVILSVREHFNNRVRKTSGRIFANSKGRAWVTEDNREPLDEELVGRFLAIFDLELCNRLPTLQRLVVDREAVNIAVPISDKNKASGFGIMPRGSIMPVAPGILRFFIYWKQKSERTDYDLSVMLLDKNFQMTEQVSWTRLRGDGGFALHSGDITQAPNGASEFIDIDLSRVKCQYIIPQVNVFSGEDFNEVDECFFGFMERTREQMGKPFEAKTVRMKSDLRGAGRVVLPLVFMRNEEGGWSAKWLHLYLRGLSYFNRVEANRLDASLLARTIVEREYLTLGYLIDLLRRKPQMFDWYDPDLALTEPVTFIGLEAPQNLPKGSKVITTANLQDLLGLTE